MISRFKASSLSSSSDLDTTFCPTHFSSSLPLQMRGPVVGNIRRIQRYVRTPAICGWAVGEAVLGLQGLALGIVHDVEVAHFILVGWSKQYTKNPFNDNPIQSQQSKFFLTHPVYVIRLRWLSMVQRDARMSPGRMGSLFSMG